MLILLYYLLRWSKLAALRSIPSGHVMLVWLMWSEFCCWRWQVLAKDSIANAPLARLKSTILITKKDASTTTRKTVEIIRNTSRRSANRNYKSNRENRFRFLSLESTHYLKRTDCSRPIIMFSIILFLLMKPLSPTKQTIERQISIDVCAVHYRFDHTSSLTVIHDWSCHLHYQRFSKM